MKLDRTLLPVLAIVLLSGLTLAPSCNEKKAPVKPATGGEERAMKKEKKHRKPEVFRPQVAGRFYDADPERLKKAIDGYLDRAAEKEKHLEGDLLGLIVPHAGYPYSGPVAAHAFELLRRRKFKRVVVLGPAHRRAFSKPALLDADVYRTPLGDIPIDREGVAALAKSGAASVDDDKFTSEHALEVELPFLQATLGEFELVPVMISRLDPESALRLAQALKQAFPGDDTLYVASTDLSHDYPYDVAVAMDENAMRHVKALDADGLYKADSAFRGAGMNVRVGDEGRPEPDCAQLCGLGTVITLLKLAKEHGSAKAVVLDRRNSGDIIGDRNSRIVGYAAAAVTLAKQRPEAKKKHAGSKADYLNEAEKKELLQIARKTLEAYLEKDETLDFEPENKNLTEPGAAFVTLRKHGRLRGCIGHMEPSDPLWKMIRDRAINAAVHDGRFEKVTAAELADIQVEISVLTPRVDVKDPLSEIEIGRDGVWMQLGMNRGVFLPQVPVEQGWDSVDIYLDHLCRKAHVPQPGCWKSPEAKIQRFTALVFAEGE